jgi:hypothetical protein
MPAHPRLRHSAINANSSACWAAMTRMSILSTSAERDPVPPLSTGSSRRHVSAGFAPGLASAGPGAISFLSLSAMFVSFVVLADSFLFLSRFETASDSNATWHHLRHPN